MKKYLLLTLCKFLVVFTYAQVPNDDCSTATDLGTLSISWNEICSDATNNYSVAVSGNTFNATPSSPYYFMNGCYGYDTSTTTLANDKWFKFKNPIQGIALHVPTSDTIHINVYYGTDCSNLQPSGCWTHDLSINDHLFYSSNDTSHYNYIQISGVTTSDYLYYGLCIRAWSAFISSYGTIHINNNTSIHSIDPFHNIFISPNPTNGTFTLNAPSHPQDIRLEIFDITGKLIYKQGLDNVKISQEVTLPSYISNGIYNCVITSGGARRNKKIAIVKQ